MRKINRSAIENLPEAQRAEATELLLKLESQYKANPLLRYEPHDKQVVFHSSHEQIKAFLGGNRSGKTTAGILDDLIQAVDRDCRTQDDDLRICILGELWADLHSIGSIRTEERLHHTAPFF